MVTRVPSSILTKAHRLCITARIDPVPGQIIVSRDISTG